MSQTEGEESARKLSTDTTGRGSTHEPLKDIAEALIEEIEEPRKTGRLQLALKLAWAVGVELTAKIVLAVIFRDKF